MQSVQASCTGQLLYQPPVAPGLKSALAIRHDHEHSRLQIEYLYRQQQTVDNLIEIWICHQTHHLLNQYDLMLYITGVVIGVGISKLSGGVLAEEEAHSDCN